MPAGIVLDNDRFSVVRAPDGSNALRALRAFRAGEILCPLGIDRIAHDPERHSVQVGPAAHALVDPVALRFTNHSCDPSVVFDTDARCIRAIRAIPAGGEITYFYPSTEWHMAEPFRCSCGSASCLGTIAGAFCLPADVLAGFELSGHIRHLVAAREAEASPGPLAGVSGDAGPGSRDALEKDRPIGALVRLLAKYVRPHPWMAFALLISLLFESGIESGTRFSFRFLIDEAVIPRDSSKLLLLLLVLAAAGILLTLLCVLADYLWARLGTLVLSSLREDLFEHVQTLSLDFYARRSSGDVLSCFMADANEIENFLATVVPYALLGVTGLIFSASLMASIHPLLAFSSLVAVTACLTAPQLLAGRARRASFETRRQEGQLSSTIQESLQSPALIKVFGLEREAAKRFRKDSEKLVSLSVRSSFLAYIVQRIPAVSFFLICLAIFGASSILAFKGRLSIGEVVSFQVLVLGLSSAVSNLTWISPLLLGAGAGMQRLNEIFRESPAVRMRRDAPAVNDFATSIVFDHVCFTYGPGNRAGEAVHDVSLTVNKGDFAVLVGPSGSGKSTLLHLLLRLHEPAAGRILIDGVDARDLEISSFRALMGFVAQDVFLYNLSIRENVRMGRLDATDEEIWRALDAAEIGDFVRGLPQGFHTVAGERGTKLSGGERQRLALARALVRWPTILLLDEAMSSLDAATEAEVLTTIRRLSDARRMTVIAATHRLRAAPMATHVVVMRKGRIESDGRHEQLLLEHGTYANLWQSGGTE